MRFLAGKKTFKGILVTIVVIAIVIIGVYLYYNKFKLYREIQKIEDGPQKQLYLAIVKDDIHLLRDALNKGANPDFDGYLLENALYIPPPIYYAIKTENARILQLLIYEGANVNKGFEKECNAPLYYAIENGNCKIIGMLIGYGARLSNIETCSYLNIINRYSKNK